MTSPWLDRRHRPIVAVAIGTLVIAALAFAGPIARHVDAWRTRQVILGHVNVLEAEFAHLRPSEARMLTTTRYVAASRAAERPEGLVSPRATIARASLERLLPEITDADNLAIVGAARAVEGNMSGAIDLLEPLLRTDRTSARVVVALSGAYFMRGQPGDMVRAFDVAASFSHRFPDHALRFNLALAGSNVLPSREAAALWEAYEQSETEPHWREEANARAKVLRSVTRPPARDTVDENSQLQLGEARAAVYDADLHDAAGACQSGEWGQRPDLHRRLVTRTAELRAAGDGYLHDVTRRLFSPVAEATCNPKVADLISRFLDARAMYRRDQRVESITSFERLVPRLSTEVPALALEARLYLTTSRYFTAARAGVLPELDHLVNRTTALNYPQLLARMHWMQGYVLQDQGRYEAALRSYQAAEREYRQAADLDGLAAVQSVLSTLFDSLGDYVSGWRQRDQALAHVSRVRDPRARYTTLSEAARSSSRDGLLAAGLHFSRAAVVAAIDSGSDLRVVEASIERARLEWKSNNRDEAVRTLESAERLADAGGSSVGARTRAALFVLRSEVTASPAERLVLLDRALDTYRSAGSDMLLARLLLDRARAHRVLGNSPAAEADYAAGIEVFERLRTEISDASRRLSYFEEAWSLFDDMIALQVEQGEFSRALEFATRARTAKSHGLAAALRLPQNARLVSYVVLEQRTVVWVFGPDTVVTRILNTPRATIQRLSREFRDALIANADTDRIRRTGGEFYDRLVAPIDDLIAAATHLAVVPDPLLQSVPIAAFWRAASGRYLVQDHEITLLSAIPSIWPPEQPAATLSRALVIGDPSIAFSHESLRLPALPGAQAEAREIAALYPTSTLLIGDAATRDAFLRDAPGHEVIHFAGHALVNADVPALSRLLLASTPNASGAIYEFELRGQSFGHTSVVVLAGCDTAIGKTYRSEGVASLARGFLSAGVPAVVATLWQIRDDASVELFTAFHKRLRNGQTPSRAIRDVQLSSLLHRVDAMRSPSVWAALVTISNPEQLQTGERQ